MKKCFVLFVTILLIIISNQAFAYSESFQFLIQTMEIDVQNPHGKKLNEDIYNKYSLFVYGTPLDGYSEQRFKTVQEGNCAKGIGVWNGAGERGEYWILGENNLGLEVHNHKFPVDIEPPTPPTQWRYAIISGAKESWQDQSKYMDDYQKEYMLNTNLMRNDISYDITAISIGLDKVRLENYATWKTKGSVYTQRYDMQNKRWAANFMVPPMAADAELDGYASFPNGREFVLDKDEISLTIPILFGAKMINLSDYARPEHVKSIKSELYIEGELVDVVEDSEKVEIGSNYIFVFDKTVSDEIVTIEVVVKSSLLTKFTTDSALVDIKKYSITIKGKNYIEKEPVNMVVDENNYIEEKTYINRVYDEKYAEYPENPPPYIESVTIKKDDDSNVFIAKNTGKRFVLAGQTIKLEVVAVNFPNSVTLEFEGDSSIYTFDKTTQRFEWEEPKSRRVNTLCPSLNEFKKMFSKVISFKKVKSYETKTIYTLTYVIPYETKQTLNSWNTLREESKDAFNIDERKLFSRIRNPYELVVKVRNANGADTKRVDLDVFERWDTLYNRDLTPYISK
ncbi:MAG: hypothetical protein IKR04_00865 [Clostridia bacterium]|nr:hypothetical protein [Clostridia bacterium]